MVHGIVIIISPRVVGIVSLPQNHSSELVDDHVERQAEV